MSERMTELTTEVKESIVDLHKAVEAADWDKVQDLAGYIQETAQEILELVEEEKEDEEV